MPQEMPRVTRRAVRGAELLIPQVFEFRGVRDARLESTGPRQSWWLPGHWDLQKLHHTAPILWAENGGNSICTSTPSRSPNLRHAIFRTATMQPMAREHQQLVCHLLTEKHSASTFDPCPTPGVSRRGPVLPPIAIA